MRKLSDPSYSFGLDISEAVLQNQTIHEPLVGSVYNVPLPSARVDLAVSQELLEHLEFPRNRTSGGVRLSRVRVSDRHLVSHARASTTNGD